MKIILTTPTPHISKKYAPKICHKMRGRMAYKSLEIKGLSQRMWCTNRLLRRTNSDFYGVRGPPPFMPYEPFLLGWGWSLICWINIFEGRADRCSADWSWYPGRSPASSIDISARPFADTRCNKRQPHSRCPERGVTIQPSATRLHTLSLSHTHTKLPPNKR